MHQRIINLVGKSVGVLKTQFSKNDLLKVKNQLYNVHQGKVNVSESIMNLKHFDQINLRDTDGTKEAYYNLGSLISTTPSGPIKVLREAFDEGNTSVSKEFLEYQTEVIGYVYTQVQDME
jgi:hypothetical protein